MFTRPVTPDPSRLITHQHLHFTFPSIPPNKKIVWRDRTRAGDHVEASTRHSKLLKNTFRGTELGSGRHHVSLLLLSVINLRYRVNFYDAFLLFILSDFNQIWWLRSALGSICQWWRLIDFPPDLLSWWCRWMNRFFFLLSVIYCARFHYSIFHDFHRPRKSESIHWFCIIYLCGFMALVWNLCFNRS